MPLIETDSLVIKSYNLAEADRIIVFLTRDYGMVRGVAKGAKRLRSRFGSGLEPFSEVRCTYFQKDNAELVSIQGLEIIRSNFATASEPAFLQKFAYLGDLLTAFLPPHDPNETLYRMTKACIEAATADSEKLEIIGLYFEIWLLRLSGFLPDWSRCDDCGRTLAASEEANVQSNFQLLCPQCRRASSSRVLNDQHRGVIRDILRLAPAEFSRSVRDPELIRYTSQLVRDVITSALGREIFGRTAPIT